MNKKAPINLKLSLLAIAIAAFIFVLLNIGRWLFFKMDGTLSGNCLLYDICSINASRSYLIVDIIISVVVSAIIIGLSLALVNRKRSKT